MALGHRERVVGAAGATFDLGLLDVVEVLDEPSEAQDVLGHPLTPLAAGLRVGECLAQRSGRVGQGVRDFGVCLERVGDLAEVLGARSAERGDHLAQLGELGSHLRVHLVEAGVDDVLLRGQLRRGLFASGRGEGAELFTLERGGLVQRRIDRRVALGRSLQPRFCHSASHGRVDRELQRFVRCGQFVGACLGVGGHPTDGEQVAADGSPDGQQHDDDE